MAHTQAEVLLQLKYEYDLIPPDDEAKLLDFDDKLCMILPVWELTSEVSYCLLTKF